MARLVEQRAGDCPGGRLRARQHAQVRVNGHGLEPHFEPSIGLVQDTAKGVGGPLWVKAALRCTVQTALRTRLETVLRYAVAVPPATSRFVMVPTFHPTLKTRTDAVIRRGWRGHQISLIFLLHLTATVAAKF